MSEEQSDTLANLRHSAAHLLAAAVLELRPGSKLTIGPATEEGFYYDFDLTEPISADDFPALEKKMHELVAGWTTFTHRTVSADEAGTFPGQSVQT
jgi:threonyl-tRNA synthetase